MAASLCDWKQKREEGRGRGGRPGDRLIHCSPEEPAVSQRKSLTVIYFAGSRTKGSLQMSCLSRDEAEETFPIFTLSAFRVTNGGCLKSLFLKCDDPSKYVQLSSVASTYTGVFSCSLFWHRHNAVGHLSIDSQLEAVIQEAPTAIGRAGTPAANHRACTNVLL